jgi:hypothetical protein
MAAAVETSNAYAAGIALAEANINWERYAPSKTRLILMAATEYIS